MYFSCLGECCRNALWATKLSVTLWVSRHWLTFKGFRINLLFRKNMDLIWPYRHGFWLPRVQIELWDLDDAPVPRKELLQKVKGVDALLCVLTEKIDAELLNAAGLRMVFESVEWQMQWEPLSNMHICDPTGPNLKVLSTMSVGFDHLSLEELKKR